jgi:hypothetical protein
MSLLLTRGLLGAPGSLLTRGLGAFTQPAEASLNVFGAIRLRAEASSTLMALIPGGIYQDTADREAWDNPPFAVVTSIAQDPTLTTGRWRHIIERMQVAFYGAGRDSLERCIREWHNVFGPTMEPMPVLEPEDVAGNYVVVNLRTIEEGDAGITPSGESLRVHVVEFNAFPDGS